MAGGGGGAASESAGVLLVGVAYEQHCVVALVDHLERDNASILLTVVQIKLPTLMFWKNYDALELI